MAYDKSMNNSETLRQLAIIIDAQMKDTDPPFILPLRDNSVDSIARHLFSIIGDLNSVEDRQLAIKTLKNLEILAESQNTQEVQKLAALIINPEYQNIVNTLENKAYIDLIREEWKLEHNKKDNHEEAILRIEGCLFNKSATLDLRGLNLSSLPENWNKLSHVKKILLSNNNLSTLPIELCQLPKLTRIALEGNRFETLPKEFYSHPNIKHFNLTYDKLKEIFPQINHRIVADLNLWAAQTSCDDDYDINEIVKEVYDNFIEKNDTLLELCGKNLKDLPFCLCEFTHLVKLDLSYNDLEEFPLQICSLVRLRTLDISYNEVLGNLPHEIGNLKELREFKLAKTAYDQLPDEITSLTKLYYLDISLNTNSEWTESHVFFPQIYSLTNLKYLDLSFSDIGNISEEIRNLVNLKELILNNNDIKTIPKEIGLLTNLENLSLSDNPINGAIPVEIGNCRKLIKLYLSDIGLNYLPIEFCNLINLEQLDVSNNISLSQLPLSLGNIRTLNDIEFESTQISLELVNQILDLSQTLRNDESIKSLIPRINLWLAAAKSEGNQISIENLTDLEKGEINVWLRRLEMTTDFQRSQTELAKKVCAILHTVVTDIEFKNLFIPHVHSNNEACEDRSAMSFNEIYVAWVLHSSKVTEPLNHMVVTLTGAAKTLTLRRILANLIEKHNKKYNLVERESVEIFLYYETTLKNRLGLLTAIDTMSYNEIGQRAWIKVDELCQQVEQTYMEELIKIPYFEKIRDKDEGFQKIWEPINNQFSIEFEKLMDEAPKVDNELDPIVLAHKVKQGEFMAMREQKKNQISKDWFQSIIAIEPSKKRKRSQDDLSDEEGQKSPKIQRHSQ